MTIASAVGYAVFSNFGMKLCVAGGGTGKGMAVNNKTKAGLGFGVKKFRLVWVFVNAGRELGAQATAAATGSVHRKGQFQRDISVALVYRPAPKKAPWPNEK